MSTRDIETDLTDLMQGLGPVDRPVTAARVMAAAGRRKTRFRAAVATASAVAVIGLAVGVTTIAGPTSGGGPTTGQTTPLHPDIRETNPVPAGSLAAAVGDGTVVATGTAEGRSWTVRAAVLPSLAAFAQSHPDVPGLPPIGECAIFVASVDGKVVAADFGPLTPTGFQVVGGVAVSSDSAPETGTALYYGTVQPGADHVTVTYPDGRTAPVSIVTTGGHTLAVIAVPEGPEPTMMSVFDQGGKLIATQRFLHLYAVDTEGAKLYHTAPDAPTDTPTSAPTHRS